MERTVVVANMPTHYRAPVFDRLHADFFHVTYSARVEPTRLWQAPRIAHAATFLAERYTDRKDGVNVVHDNREIWRVLSRLSPRVVVVGGLNPTHLYAIAWAIWHRARVVYMTDGTLRSESHLGLAHRLLRRIAFRLCRAFVVAGGGGRRLLEAYGVRPRDIFVSRLCASPATGPLVPREQRPFDVLFCGRLHPAKMPDFFVRVCARIRERRGSCRALVVGSGPAEPIVRDLATHLGVEVKWAGFVQPAELTSQYSAAAVLLFPTAGDPWGLVANEAMAVGTPVITMPAAGCAGDLVVDSSNGRVLEADVDRWASAACELLDDHSLWRRYSLAAVQRNSEFNFEDSAKSLETACDWAGRQP